MSEVNTIRGSLALGPVALEVYNPTGAVQEVTNRHAPRLADLQGKTIGEISNGWWEAKRTFPLIRQLLQKRVPGLKVIPYADLPFGSKRMDLEDVGDIAKKRGCDAVIVGNSA